MANDFASRIEPRRRYHLSDTKYSRHLPGGYQSYGYISSSKKMAEGMIIYDEYCCNGDPFEIISIIPPHSEHDDIQLKVKPLPYIEVIKEEHHYKHIFISSPPFHDKIIKLLYNEKKWLRSFNTLEPLKDLVFLTEKGYIFSYYDIERSFPVNDFEFSFKLYLEGVLKAATIYAQTNSREDTIKFLESLLLLKHEIQVGKSKNGDFSFFINFQPSRFRS